MTNDERASLVTNEYRYTIITDPTIKANYPQAQDIEVDTNLDQASALAYGNSIFARTSTFAQTYTVPAQGALYLEDFTTQPPRFTLAFDRHPTINATTPFTVIGATVDFFAGTETLTVRG